MTNVLEQYEAQSKARLLENKKMPDFGPGDTVVVNVWIIEGKNKRIQAYEGLCIARRNRGLGSSFTVRKISHGEGVERVFPVYSPLTESVEVLKRGDVRRAKLYYMRELTGKAARIKEKNAFVSAKETKAKTAKAGAKAASKKAAADA